MKSRSLDFGVYKRPDGEQFHIAATLYESPMSQDYWLALYDVKHSQWGNQRFTLMVPKNIAKTVDFALVMVGGVPLDQVRSFLDKVTSKGRSLDVCFSPHGWILA